MAGKPDRRGTVEERLWSKVDVQEPGCWRWLGAKTPRGYGNFSVDPKKTMVRVHRYVYEICVGPIPNGLTIDHLCGNPSCVNPAHMEPVTRGENTLRGASPPSKNARKETCRNGHPLTIRVGRRTGAKRTCKICQKAYDALKWKRIVAAKRAVPA
jgi:hypothetical protein